MSIYLLDALPPGRALTWTFLCDPNKRHGALLTGIDYEGNVYCCAEHYKVGIPDRLHAQAYREILGRFKLVPERVSFFADPGGAGAQAIINIADLGIYAEAVKKDAGSVKASIELVRRAAWVDPTHPHPLTGVPGAPYLYFLTSLKSQWTEDGVDYYESRLLWELRQYRQKPDSPPDTPIKERDDLVDPLRYHFLVRAFAPEQVDDSMERERAKLDKLSRKASEEFDQLAAKVMRGDQKREEDW